MTDTWDGDDYQQRFDALAAAGQDLHGEARFVLGHQPRSVLDAGCGTGRVAIELARLGLEVTGVDVDESMLATAARHDVAVTWVHADLVGLDLGATFDVVVMAGNVPLFAVPETRDQLVASVADHVAEGGVLIAGFSTDWRDRPYDVATYDAACAAAGLELVTRHATWDGDAWTEASGYAVSVHGRASAPPRG